MFSRGRIFCVGLCVFVGGFVIPVIINLVARILMVGRNAGYDILYYTLLLGTSLSLLVGGPLMIISFFMPSSEKRRR